MKVIGKKYSDALSGPIKNFTDKLYLSPGSFGQKSMK